ncbi:MAG: DNA polymerase III subunit delta' [Ardenticatenaceae bacterium]|nr:DNA polymerase III subunit delta' [Anaerolineales bacterium]MCB8920342.1 DNA polymerase III subunit delta' [Ardenticatenaceae bacterium]
MSTWNQIIGHDWAVRLLQGAITHQRVGHAYLITGPEQIGKTTLARTFAQALNCEAVVGERPCGQCRTCQLVAANRHPDVRLLEPEVSKRGKATIKIDAVRELQRGLNLAAYEARMKVAILRQFDAANANAANAFLKTLEEPPANVVLLLTATDADTLLPTIASRCRVIGLRPLPLSLIEQSLTTRWHVPEKRAYLLAHLADGRLGWAVQASQDATILQERESQLEQLEDVVNGRRVDRFNLADKLSRKPEQLPALLKNWLSWWRDLALLTQVHKSVGTHSLPIHNIDQESRLHELIDRWSSEQIQSSLKQTDLALWQLERNANTRLVLENLFLTYPLL